MSEKKPEKIYEKSINELIKKFIDNDKFFLSEKDLHFYFFYLCLNKNRNQFEHRERLLIHSEYPMPFKTMSTNEPDTPIKIVEDKDEDNEKKRKKRRLFIDSVLLNKNFIEWLSKREYNNECYKKYKDYKSDCIRGRSTDTDYFSTYIKHFREDYAEFYENCKESVLSYSLEFKFCKGGGEGAIRPINDILYDLKKLSFIANTNGKLNFPFSKECTLLVFIGGRGSPKIIDKINNKYKDDNTTFKKFNCNPTIPLKKEKPCVIRFDFIKK